MPNPVKPLPKSWEKSRKLSPRQKKIVKNFRKRYGNRTIYYYPRAGAKTGISIHAPLTDSQKRAKKASMEKVKRYPHAYDTRQQRVLGKRKVKAVKSNKRVKGKGLLQRLFP